jgi:hypothetical protein
VGRRAPAITAVGRIERTEVELRDGVQHEPSEVVLGKPLAQARRQQQLLVAITRKKVLTHPHTSPLENDEIVATGSDDKAPAHRRFMRHPHAKAEVW